VTATNPDALVGTPEGRRTHLPIFFPRTSTRRRDLVAVSSIHQYKDSCVSINAQPESDLFVIAGLTTLQGFESCIGLDVADSQLQNAYHYAAVFERKNRLYGPLIDDMYGGILQKILSGTLGKTPTARTPMQ
jgi:hypothetical protein